MAHADKIPTNKLINEDSPYLLQHAHNPIDWYPWGEEAFSKAKKEDKLIFLSIGYSTCHWCHVMERESFENEKVAEFMNAHYVCIKMDREEYPHIDRYYQDVYMLLNKRSGGWPLNLVLTPDKKPFFAATYLPPINQYGRVGLLGMMQYLYETFRDKRENVYKSADSIVYAMQNYESDKSVVLKGSEDAKLLIRRFVEQVQKNYDSTYCGIGESPKFPHATTLQTLLLIYRLDGDKRALSMAIDSLYAMAKGGIYDQVEGGFYRYSVDKRWEIPHFEKMLYTNAELVEAYSEAYKITQETLFLEVINETVENIESRFGKEGVYFSASDADSDGEEGKYFVFGYHEVKEALQKEGFRPSEIKEVMNYFGMTKRGNFEGKNNPTITSSKKPAKLIQARRVLFHIRKRKNYPFIDYKIQTSWNALWIKALFCAASIDKKYAKRALKSLQKLLELIEIEGDLYHQVVLPHKPKVKAYLEDYAFLIAALLEAYRYTLEEAYLKKAQHLSSQAVAKFYEEGKWYMSDDNFRSLASSYDASYRSALAVMAENLFILSNLGEDQKMYAFAKEVLKTIGGNLTDQPENFPTLTRSYLGYTYGWVVIKSAREKLLLAHKEIEDVYYPFVLLLAGEYRDFYACKIDSCFAVDEDISKVVAKIE